MYNLTLKFGSGNTTYDISELENSVTLTGRKGAAPRNATITLFDSEGYSMQRAEVDVAKGQWCYLYLEGKEIFRGLIMTETKSSQRKLTIKAWDNAIYLANSKDSFSYKNKRADEIFRDCCRRAGLTVGEAVKTGKVISELTKTSATYWDVIQEALSETYSSTGRRYYVTSKNGKMYLYQRKEESSMPQLEVATNTESYEQTRSIYDTRTRLKLVTSKNKTKRIYVNESLENKIGKFAEVQTVNTDATATELNQKINTFKENKSLLSQSMTWTGTGDISVVAGGCVYVTIPALGLKQVMYVEEDTHTFSKGKHQMKLKLNYAADFKESGAAKDTITYQVTARSGLNLRKEPNSTIIATMPNGTVVESDGKTKSGWIHVSYNGKWGYAYSAYLKKL